MREWISSKQGPIFSNRVSLLLFLLIALVAADGVISHFLITRQLAFEVNPLMRNWVSERIFLVLKLGGGAFCALMLWFINKRLPKVTHVVIVSAVTLYTAIIYWNLLAFLVAVAV